MAEAEPADRRRAAGEASDWISTAAPQGPRGRGAVWRTRAEIEPLIEDYTRMSADARRGFATGLAIGTVQWGLPYGIANPTGPPDAAEIDAMIALAHAAGVETLDTARAYGRSESVIGQTLSPDSRFRVVTKLDPSAHEGDMDIAAALAATGASLAASRRALRRDHLDIVLLHRARHRHACGGKLWRRLLREREEGGIGALGLAAATPQEAWDALGDPDIEVIQVAASLLDQRLVRHGFFQQARDQGKRVFVRSIYLQGVAHLDPAELPSWLSPLREPLAEIHEWARAQAISPREAFLAYARSLPGVKLVIGCERLDQLVDLFEDWRSDRVDPTRLAALAGRLPELPEPVLDPSQWAELEQPRVRPAGAVSVAPGGVHPATAAAGTV